MRRYGITIGAVLLAIASNVAACILYVEIPDPYTKEDYLAAVKGRGLNVRVLELVKADAYRQMEAIADPYADFVVHVTKNGEVIRPDWEKIKSKEPGEVKTTCENTYVRGDGWDDARWAQANKHIEGAYPKIKQIYDEPWGSGGRTVTVDLDEGAPNYYYSPSQDKIVMAHWDYYDPYFFDAYALTHEMVHSFHDDLVINWSQFEEGFAEAVAHEVQNLMRVAEGSFCELFHRSGPFYGYYYNEFQFNQNMPGIGTRLESFSSPNSIGGSAMRWYRYRAAGYCWWKVWFADRDFFIGFNNWYYDHPTNIFSELQEGAIDCYSEGTLEGIPFSRWIYEQEVINIPPPNTKVMFLTVLWDYYRLWLYERKNEPEEEEVAIPFERVDFDVVIVGMPEAVAWTDYTNVDGSIDGYLDFPDQQDRRLRLSAYALKPDLLRVVFSWGTEVSPTPDEIELCGATTGALTGTARLLDLDTGGIWTQPVVNGAFHFAALPGLPDGDARYALTLLDDLGIPIKTVWFNKDAAAYFAVINDLDSGDSTAAAEPVGPLAARALTLSANAPNPAKSFTSFTVTLGAPARVEVVVFDLAGRRVAKPFAGTMNSGDNEVNIDTSSMPPGVYVYHVTAGRETAVRKMVVAR
jgi:hypothetical protein